MDRKQISIFKPPYLWHFQVDGDNLKPYPYFKDPDALLEFMSEGREIRDQRQTKDGSISRRIAK